MAGFFFFFFFFLSSLFFFFFFFFFFFLFFFQPPPLPFHHFLFFRRRPLPLLFSSRFSLSGPCIFFLSALFHGGTNVLLFHFLRPFPFSSRAATSSRRLSQIFPADGQATLFSSFSTTLYPRRSQTSPPVGILSPGESVQPLLFRPRPVSGAVRPFFSKLLGTEI